jgi:hypothetical protein
MATTIKHMSMNIAGALRNAGKRKMTGLLSDDDGRELSDKEVRQHLSECLAKGWKLIPAGECEGFDYFGGGCPGHEVKENEESLQISK